MDDARTLAPRFICGSETHELWSQLSPLWLPFLLLSEIPFLLSLDTRTHA